MNDKSHATIHGVALSNKKTAIAELRTEKELEPMHYLNSKVVRDGGYFKCDLLGVLHIFWGRHGWETKWIKIEPYPTSEELDRAEQEYQAACQATWRGR